MIVSEKYTITRGDVQRIKDIAMEVFRDRRGFGDLDNREIQTLLIAEALKSFLRSKGVEVNFDIDFDPYKRYLEVKS